MASMSQVQGHDPKIADPRAVQPEESPAGETVDDHLEEDAEGKPEKKLVRTKSTRGKAFSAHEGLKLAKAWVAQRTENIQQKDADMWRGIEEKCRMDEMNRSAASLKKVWSFLQRNTLKYLAAKYTVERSRVGDESAEETERRVMELYRKNLGDVKHGNFKFVMAANWLQHQPKFFEAYGAVAEVNHVQVPVALEMVPKEGDIVMESMGMEAAGASEGITMALESGEVVLKRPAPEMLPASQVNGARPVSEKRQRTEEGPVDVEEKVGSAAEELAGIKRAITDGLAVANRSLQQFLDIQLLGVMKEGEDKRELYAAVVEERKFRAKERTMMLRKELQGDTHLPDV